MYERYEKRGLSNTAVGIADSVGDSGLDGATVLEIGCGFGALALELVRRGASAAVGMDLSPKMVRLASRLASEKGLSDRASFRLGDGATSVLPMAEIVVLDAVLCCYPDMRALVENSSSAAQKCYAISVPDDNRLATKVLRLLLPLQGVILHRTNFRFFIHRTRFINEVLQSKGFRLTSSSPAGLFWSILVFSRG